MPNHAIANIIESLVMGDLGIDDFMRAVQHGVEAQEAAVQKSA